MSRLGLVVPCHDEAAVLGRKLRNLAAARWPPGGGHRLVVVDDHSEDGTAAVARDLVDSAFADLPQVTVEVLASDRTPGKAGALAAGLAALTDGEPVDLLAISDADVVLHADALPALAAAFTRDPRLGMACGSQRFVASLSDDGSVTDADDGPVAPSPSRYDLVTARVRALESRSGRLFSVHGQLLAWRADLDLSPTPGLAADDLDLMVQVRARGLAVAKVDDALFFEVKTAPGPDRRAQELRRAQAYAQIVERFRLPPGAGLVDRLHFAAYRTLPLAAPWLALGITAGTPVALALAGRPTSALAVAVALLVLWLTPGGRRLARLLLVIARASARQRRRPLSDRWEMSRQG